MKKFQLFTLLGIFAFVQAQYSDLGSLSEGRLNNFHSVEDNDGNLFGYLAFYTLDKVDNDTKKFEYVFLDKNLNEVSSKEWNTTKIVDYYYGFINDINEIIVKPSYSLTRIKDFKKFGKPDSYVIDMPNNDFYKKIYYCYEDELLKECEEDERSFKEQYKDNKNKRKDQGYIYESVVRQLKDHSFLVYDYQNYSTYSKNNRIQRYDADKNKLWEFNFNENSDRKNFEIYYMLEWDDDYAFFLKYQKAFGDESYELIAMDVKEGKILSEYPLTNNFSEFNPLHILEYDDNIFNDEDRFTIFGMLVNGYNFTGKNSLGYNTFNYDKKLNRFYENSLYFSELSSFIDIDENGSVDKKYNLYVRDLFFLKDGSIGILTEKGKYKNNGKLIATDMVVISTDKNLKPKEVIVLNKDKTKAYGSTDYLFSQYLNNEKDVAFFYRDYQKDDSSKDKNWILYINTIIDGKFKQDQIPISSDKNFIYPSMAKEGYILLREYNENEKYDQIRLERLNF